MFVEASGCELVSTGKRQKKIGKKEKKERLAY
jgi:hypothetical protein